MPPAVLCPTSTGLEEVAIFRRSGVPEWQFDSPERRDRIRAAIANSGFALPGGELCSLMPIAELGPHADLPLALCVLLSDRSNEHLQREGWIAWGGLGLDGGTIPIEQPLVNDLGPKPCVGRVWDPTDHIPEPHEDAVISLVEVANLEQAWDVITAFARMEERIFEGAGIPDN